ncbi:MAG TPA: hypothetical protein VJ888_00815 [Mobilitalea sp.]|nr:hypothetical protein [Mobilitalea sp.]
MIQNGYKIKQYTISPVAGMRLIAKALIQIPEVLDALENRTIVIISGRTNRYVAEEFLNKTKQQEGFYKEQFFRGITLSSDNSKFDLGRSGHDGKFLGDVVITKGEWQRGLNMFHVADQLRPGDLIFKGANAVNLETLQAATLIGHPAAGTINPVLKCVGRGCAKLYLPIGLNKRIMGDIKEISAGLNMNNLTGVGYMPISGTIITELQAIKIISGCEAELVAIVGLSDTEAAYRIAVTGLEQQIMIMDEAYSSICKE